MGPEMLFYLQFVSMSVCQRGGPLRAANPENCMLACMFVKEMSDVMCVGLTIYVSHVTRRCPVELYFMLRVPRVSCA